MKHKKILNLSDFKPGFKYKAFVGYGWITCEYPETGFYGDQQIQMAIDSNIVRPIK